MAVHEEKWWLASSLTKEQRNGMSLTQKAERRERIVLDRLKANEARFTNQRHKKMSRWLRQWVRGVAFREMVDAGRVPSLKAWLRSEFVEAIKDAFRGNGYEHVLESAIRAEIGKSIAGRGWSKGDDGRAAFKNYIDKIVKEEVRKQLMESVTIDVAVKGRVFSPAQGQRRIDLGEEQD